LASHRGLSFLAYAPFVLALAIFPVAFGGVPATRSDPIPVNAMALDAFKPGAGPRFGDLEFLGGLVMATPKGEMGATSSIRITEGGRKFVAIMDTGHWAEGVIERDTDGRLTGLSDYRIYPMLSERAPSGDRKDDLDAEGMVIAGDRVFVSYEGRHRIAAFPYPGYEDAAPLDVQTPVLDGQRLRSNGGIEALLKSPDDGPLEGSLVYVAERSYNPAGDFIAGVQSGPKRGVFHVKRLPPYDVTDGVFLEDGSFLLLERKFGLAGGIGMRIRRFEQADIAPGATIAGKTVMEADFSHQIDNMEGLDAYRAPDGSTHLILVSDDNHSLLERNLMLEFRLLP
jgi:hypothetical protein